MSLILCWLLFPILFGAVSFGMGLLAEQAARRKVAGAFLLPLGFAATIVVGELITWTDATAELATPVVAVLAVLGFALARPWEAGWRLTRWEAGSALAVFAVFAAPIVLSGSATFAGYIKLDDTSTWMAFTDWVMSHGPSVHGLAPSSYEATLQINLGGGYPVGGFVPLGIATKLSGQDVAWTIQPFMAMLGAMLALALSGLLEPHIPSRPARAAVSFIAAQPALLYGYYLWGGIKEIESAVLIVLVAALATVAVPKTVGLRWAVPLALAAAGLIGVFGIGAGVWLVPLLLPVALLLVRAWGRRPGLDLAAGVAGLTIVFAIPVLARGVDALLKGGIYSPTGSKLPGNPLGNLIGPLNPFQVVGVWPAADFRIDPSDTTLTILMIAVAIGAALLGLFWAWQDRDWGLPTYVIGGFAGGLVIVAIGIPWVDGKVFATLSPAILAAAGAAGAALLARGPRAAGFAVLGLLAAGVLWSNGLAYTQVNLAPRGELRELQHIGNQIKGDGPTLMTDDQIYGVRHFLRDADPEGVSQLRRRPITLRDGTTADKTLIGGLDAIRLADVLQYRTIVIRNSPVASRPPLPYKLIYAGRYYEVWQRGAVQDNSIADHLPLGGEVDPGAVPGCFQVKKLAREAGPGGALYAAPAPPVSVVQANQTEHPESWNNPGGQYVVPGNHAGTMVARIRVPQGGPTSFWLGGSIRGELDASVDGKHVETIRHYLVSGTGYTEVASIDLTPGVHELSLHYGGRSWRPGSGKSDTLAYPIGPIVAAPARGDINLTSVAPAQARKLCGRRWDWIEAVRG